MALAKIVFLGRARQQISRMVTDSPTFLIKRAVAEADRLTDHAAQAAQQILAQRSTRAMRERWLANDAFSRYFGTGELTKRQMTKVCNVIVTLNERVDKGLTIKVRPKAGRKVGLCRGDRSAYQASGFLGARKMNLCWGWFHITDATERGAILIHELVHATGIGWTRDLPVDNPARGADEARQFARNDPKNARRNPENMEHFMLALVGHPGT